MRKIDRKRRNGAPRQSRDFRHSELKGECYRAAGSVGSVFTAEVVVRSGAGLRVFQGENVNHGLLPLPFLRDTGRCRMLGIHLEGVRHPSSEGNKNRNRGILVAVYGPIAVWHFDAESSLHALLRKKAPRPSLLFEQLEPIHNACKSDVAPTPLSEQYEWPSIPYCVKLRPE